MPSTASCSAALCVDPGALQGGGWDGSPTVDSCPATGATKAKMAEAMAMASGKATESDVMLKQKLFKAGTGCQLSGLMSSSMP